MTFELFDVREALADQIATVQGLRATAGMFDQVNTPQVVVKLGSIDRFAQEHLTLECWLLVSTSLNRSAEIQASRFMSPDGDKSITQAIDEDPTLGGLVDDTTWRTWDSYGAVRLAEGQPEYLGARLQVGLVGGKAAL